MSEHGVYWLTDFSTNNVLGVHQEIIMVISLSQKKNK